jgi:hypothetical protein
MFVNFLARSLCGALVLALLVAFIGHAQAPNAPTGEGRISGRILTSMSEPIADATVLLGLNDTGVPVQSRAWWAVTSDQNGLYQFTDLPAGRFILVAAKDGYVGWLSIPTASPLAAGRRSFPALALAMQAPRSTVDLVPGGRASEVNLTMHRPATISGRAVRPDGSAVIKERVMLYTADETGAITDSRSGMPTDGNGAFSFSDLRPGTYYLSLPHRGRLQDIDRFALTPGTVTEGMSLRIEVVINADAVFSVGGRVVDVLGQVPRALQLEYGVPGSTHRGLLSVSSPDGRFHVRDHGIVPGPLTIIARGENDGGPMIGRLTWTTIDGPNDVEIIVGKPGGLRGRVSMERGVPPTTVGLRLTLVREGFTLEAGNLIGEYRVRVDQPDQWTVKAVRRSGTRVTNDRLVIRSGEVLDELEILIGSR